MTVVAKESQTVLSSSSTDFSQCSTAQIGGLVGFKYGSKVNHHDVSGAASDPK